MSLSNTVKAIQDIMRKDAGVDGDAQRIGQLGWMLFLKIYSDLELETELEDTKYKSPIPKKFRWESWADDSVSGKDSLTGDGLINFINNELFPKLKELDLSSFTGQARERGALLISVFDDAYNYMKNGTLLRQVINKINQDIDYNSVETRHLFGDIYEQILRDLQSAGNAGEYYTPRAVTQFAIEMVNPQLGEIVLDPACGTGGFLTGAFEHIKKQVKKPAELKALKNSIRGVEKKPLPHVLCATNMMVHGIEVPSNIINDNTLARPLRDYGKEDQVDVIVTNPPFGGVEEDGIENNFPPEVRTKETADLFISLVIELLKDGGRAAIVLPDNFLFGEGVKTSIKRRLLQECDLHTIIRLPKTVFAPYTTVATNILFFTKGKPTDDIWFYDHQLPDGVKAYNKTKPIKIEEFNSIKSWWVNREESSQSWPVTIDDVIKRNYNLDFSNPNKVDIIHDSPQNIRAIHNSLLETCNELREEIENVLNVALGREDWSILTGNVRNLKKVKLLILTLALKGSLSSPEVNDESIGDLISRLKIQIQDDFAMSEERFSIPSHWKWVPLGSISDHQLGKMLNTAKMRGEKRKYLRSVNVRQDGSIDLSDVKEMLIPEIELEKYSVRKNDLFVNEGGDVGRNAIFKIEPKEPLAFQNQLHRLRPMCGVRPEYVQMVLQQAKETNVIAEMSSGVTIQHFPANAIRRFAVPLPPIAEQDRIVERVEELFGLCNKLQANLTFSSEVSDAFADSIVAGVAKQ